MRIDERPYIAADELSELLSTLEERIANFQRLGRKARSLSITYDLIKILSEQTELKKHGETNYRMLKQLIKENAELKKELNSLKGKK